jgi:hypothetical protein
MDWRVGSAGCAAMRHCARMKAHCPAESSVGHVEVRCPVSVLEAVQFLHDAGIETV